MPTTPIRGLPYPVPADTADVPRDIKALAETLDPLIAGVADVGMTKLGEVILASPAAAIDLTAIPQTHGHLLLAVSLRGVAAAESTVAALRCNGDASASYYLGTVRGNNNTVAMTTGIAATSAQMFGIPAATTPAGADIFNAGLVFIPAYTGSVFKMMIAFNAVILGGDITRVYVDQMSALWFKPAAITRLTLDTSGGLNFATRSRATLYGMK
jgi:hypothetical protein